MTDARFEDAGDRPLRLAAATPEDISVLSSLLQDAVFPLREVAWQPKRQRFAILLNRFRWEDKAAAETAGRAYERVRAVLAADGVTGVASQGFDRSDPELVLSLLSLDFEGDAEAGGTLTLTLAGDGALRLTLEHLEVTLNDVTRPYRAVSGHAPDHPE